MRTISRALTTPQAFQQMGLKGVTFILGATPTVRFYITGAADDYAFYSDDIRLPATVGSDNWGVYLDMEISASDLSKVITYTRGGSASGSYHVSSYYTFITTDARYKDNGRLTNLVARFIRYCESASEYKNQLS